MDTVDLIVEFLKDNGISNVDIYPSITSDDFSIIKFYTDCYSYNAVIIRGSLDIFLNKTPHTTTVSTINKIINYGVSFKCDNIKIDLHKSDSFNKILEFIS